jgi:hypothetical protein
MNERKKVRGRGVGEEFKGGNRKIRIVTFSKAKHTSK